MNEKDLIQYIHWGLERQEKYNIKVENVRLEEECAFADISYNWRLNGWEKDVKHKDAVFVYKDGVWRSAGLIYCSSKEIADAQELERD